jgi:hypothetical protein
MSGQLYRAVVVAMIAMGMMQPSTHDVIDVVAMGHGFVPAGRAMLVRAAGLRRALHGICGIDCDDMLINVILMQVMKMAVMEIVDMALMADRRMPAVGTVLVGMVGMMLLGAGGHDVFSFFICGRGDRRLLPFGSMLHGAFHQTQNVSVGKRIVDVLCLASSFDKSHVVQGLEASRNGGQLFAFQLRQLGYADLATGKPRQQPKPGRITKSLKHRRCVFEFGSVR